MTYSIPAEGLFQYRRFTLYNSPFVAHDKGCAIDLYPSEESAPSPVSGTVVDTRKVRAPPKPYADPFDYLILIDTGSHIARLLHVKPTVEPGEAVSVGESIGTLVRAGFFAPWVPNHIHLGFRPYEANPYRASGSLPLEVDTEVQPLPWDGTGTVIETGETWARLDSPAHPAPGEAFVGLESDGGVLDGGFPHYEYGGLLGVGTSATIAGTQVGTLSEDASDTRTVDWVDCEVLANGASVTGIALFCARDRFGIKLVGEHDLRVGEYVTVSIRCDP